MRAVSFFRPGWSGSGAGLTGAGAGVGVGGIGEETGGAGGGDGNWGGGVAFSGGFGATDGCVGGRKGSLSRDPVSSPGGVMRTVSFLGSFGSGIRLADWFQNIARKWPVLSQKIVSPASGNSAPNELAHRRRLG